MISIALFEPQIPPNTGNIARLAAGLGIELILVGKLGFSIDDKHVKRAGLDYWENVKLNRFDSLDLFEKSSPDNRKILATTKGNKPYYDFDYKPGDIILFGSETSGLPVDYIKKNFENSVTIPMPGQVRSLNLSNSAAVIIYHALHQIGYFDGFMRNRNYYNEL